MKTAARRASSLIALLALVTAASCASDEEASSTPDTPASEQTQSDSDAGGFGTVALGAGQVAESDEVDAGRPQPLARRGSLADLVNELPPAPTGLEALAGTEAPSAPVSMSIDSIGISNAVVMPVGVEADGAMEVPPADIVGWYEFGSVPSEDGMTVLAAHVAYDGVNGVFVDLDDLSIGDEVSVATGSADITKYRVVSNRQYNKDELPDDLFARSGEPGLVLITCGGIFDTSARSYDDNIVVVAEPIT